MAKTLNWTAFQTRQGHRMCVSVCGNKRYTVSSTGVLTVTMKYGDTILAEVKTRAMSNARSYAEEIA
jgi:hypothetical protein